MKKITLSIFVSLTFLAACGKSGGSSSSSSIGTKLQEQQAEGFYRAILRPYNNSLSGFLPTGFAEIKVSGDTVQVKTLLDDDARVPHIQSIQMGTRCPTLADDTNGDGLIDIEESYKASGEVFIPLDNDLAVMDGNGTYPIGGSFTYNRSSSLSVLEGETRNRFNQSLNLGGRVVIIHGVAANTKMPATVATRHGLAPQSTIPIVCGVLQRMP